MKLVFAIGRILVLGLLGLWTTAALYYASAPVFAVRASLAGLFVLLVVTALVLGRPGVAAGIVLVAFAATAVRFATLRPRLDRDWVPNEARQAWADVEGARVALHDVRNTVYRRDADYTPRWEERAYDLDALQRAWYVVVPFRDLRVGAHTFVSFEFDGGQFVAVSIEARKQRGETYGVLPGLFRRYETIYVVADERDLIGLRSHIRKDEVFLYPVRAERDALRAFFLDMLRTANALRETPIFYHSLENTCLTGLVRHLDGVREQDLRWRLEIVFPALSDRLALEEGLLDTDLPLEEARRRYRVDARAAALDDPAFSLRIRGR